MSEIRCSEDREIWVGPNRYSSSSKGLKPLHLIDTKMNVQSEKILW